MASVSSSRQSGLTLIELMVAMVLGLLVAAGIVTVFASTSSSNKAQTQLATLQEEGRFAIARIKNDVGQVNSQYGGNTGGNASQSTTATGLPYLDGLRSPMVYAHSTTSALLTNALYDLSTSWGGTSGGTVAYPSEPTTGPYSMPSFLWLRGYDCSTTACTPVDPSNVTNTTSGFGIPAMGTAVGNRVVGSAVLTMRYMNPNAGWAIEPSGSSVTGSTITANPTVSNELKTINLAPITGEQPVSYIKANDLIMLANYSSSEIFAVTGQTSATLTPSTANYSVPAAMTGMNAVKVFDVNRDFQTVTYYLKVVQLSNGTNTGALMRRVNGGSSNTVTGESSEYELARGVERLDFKYGVLDNNGEIHFLTANQVDTATDASGNAISCPPGESNPAATGAIKGCLWRAVQSIEVDLLMDGQIPLFTLSANEEEYTYSFDSTTTALAAPSSHAVKPSDQGFPDQLLRREFTAMIATRNFNP
ncbi:PilW family protein [Rhodanobacter sp. C05]|uniref:PilW family protein n=1 Tax=Rhodanobacter sp. C05 TaxID=1945855 RepID=UPI0009873AF2|nr:PilW family protein [Rhodanobacter sp. C05]OOG40638.1 hypothetical protein B0E51_08315 [Rhodanobacter sp. C05]